MSAVLNIEDLKRRKIMEAMKASIAAQPIEPTESQINPNISLQPEQEIPFPNVPTDQQMSETSQQSRPYRVGYSAKGITGLDRDILKRKATAEAPARSEIEDRGDSIGWGAIQKPDPWWKRMGKGALRGLASGDPNNPNQTLGSAIGGAATSASSQQNASEMERHFDLRKLDNDISRGLRVEGEQAEIQQRQAAPGIAQQKIEAETAYNNEKLEVERQKAAGLITQEEARRREREIDRKQREDIATKDRESREKVAGMNIAARVKPEEDNGPIDEAIAGAKAEQAKIDEGLADIESRIKITPVQVNGYPNAARGDLLKQQSEGLRRRQELDDKIREWGIKKKPSPREESNSAKYTGKPWSLGAWRAKFPQATTEQEAAAKAKAIAAQMKVVE